MTRIRVKFKDKGLNAILQRVAATGGASCHVGIIEPKASQPSEDGRLTLAEEGTINEFGSDDGHVPRRSFFRQPIKGAATEIGLVAAGLMKDIVTLKLSTYEALYRVGKFMADKSKDAIQSESGVAPENTASTVRQKGFSHSLILSGKLVEAISHRVVLSGGGLYKSLDEASEGGDDGDGGGEGGEGGGSE